MSTYRNLSPTEKRLSAFLLQRASDEFAKHGCYDFNLADVGFTDEEAKKLVTEFYGYNGDPEELEWIKNWKEHVGDYALMGFMAHRLDPEKHR